MALKVTVVGVGLVGEAIIQCLKERRFPCEWPPRVAATRERSKVLAGEQIQVEETKEKVFEDADLVLFAGKEGAKGASVTWREKAINAGAICIDNGRDFRLADDVPLIVPEVNADVLKDSARFIASPNCSTIQMVMVLAPLHRQSRIKRIIASSYQSTSGYGVRGPEELASQISRASESLDDIPFDPNVFTHPIAFDCIPDIEPFMEDAYTREEWKFVKETRKILGDPSILISSTAVRVPVFVGHGEAIWIETERPISPDQAREVLEEAEGVVVMDRIKNDENLYPTNLDVRKYRDEVLVGRIRKDLSSPNGLVLWCVADNLRKGAALNVVQIAEQLIRRGMLQP
jgi:aspartate-semialdehyde dehydrogenase